MVWYSSSSTSTSYDSNVLRWYYYSVQEEIKEPEFPDPVIFDANDLDIPEE